jgi:hypothetical protein
MQQYETLHAGDKLMSKVVNWMIDTKPIFAVMKFGAKNAMKSTTLKAGIDWDGHVRKMQQTAEVRAGPSSVTCASTLTASCSVQLDAAAGWTNHLESTPGFASDCRINLSVSSVCVMVFHCSFPKTMTHS